MPCLIRNFNMHNDKRRTSIIRRRFLRPYISSGKRRQSGFKITRARAIREERKERETQNGEHVGQINMVNAHVPKRTRVGGLVIFGGDDFSKSNVTKRSCYKFHSSTPLRSFHYPSLHSSCPFVDTLRNDT